MANYLTLEGLQRYDAKIKKFEKVVFAEGTPAAGMLKKINVYQGVGDDGQPTGAAIGSIDIPDGTHVKSGKLRFVAATETDTAKTYLDLFYSATPAAGATADVAIDLTSITSDIDSLEAAVAKLNGNDTTEGSVAKAIKDAKEALVGTDADTKNSDTIKGAKKYADDAAAAVQGTTTETVASVDAKIAAINNETTGILATAKGYTDTEIGKLDGEVTGTGNFVKTISQTDGKVTATLGGIDVADVPTLTLAKISDAGTAAKKAIEDFDAAGAAAAVSGYGDGETAKTVKDVAGEVATLKGDVTTDGSVLKAIYDNAANAKYDESNTIAQAIASAKSTSSVTVEKLATAEETYAASYVVKQNGTQVGATINIPKDFLVKSADLKTAEEDIKSGDTVIVPKGHKYIDFVINTSDASATESHIYLDVNTLVDVYGVKEGATEVQLALDDTDNKFSATLVDGGISTAKIADKAVTKAKLSQEVQDALTATNGAMVYKGELDAAHALTAQIGEVYIKTDENKLVVCTAAAPTAGEGEVAPVGATATFKDLAITENYFAAKAGTGYAIASQSATIKQYIDSRIFVGTQAEYDAAIAAKTIDTTVLAIITDDSADTLTPITDDDIDALFD